MNILINHFIIASREYSQQETLKCEFSIPRKLEDAWEPTIKIKVNDFECNALFYLGSSISIMPKIYLMPLILDHYKIVI